MKFSYKYLNDKEFLKHLDHLQQKTLYVKILSLNWNEQPLSEITGKATGGSLNVSNGSVRRSGNISVIVDDSNRNVRDIQNIISINKKISIEVGYLNTTEYYTEYNIIWIPLGIFVTKSVALQHELNQISMNIDFADKMCLLDGSVAGTIGAAADLAGYESDYDEEDYNDSVPVKYQYVSMYDLIKEVVHHLGGESVSNMIISDIPEKLRFGRKFHLPPEIVSIIRSILLVNENNWGIMTPDEYHAVQHQISLPIQVERQTPDENSNFFSFINIDYDIYTLLVELFPDLVMEGCVQEVFISKEDETVASYIMYPYEKAAHDMCKQFFNDDTITSKTLDDAVKNLKWYLVYDEQNDIKTATVSLTKPSGDKFYETIEEGALMGSTLEPFTYSNSKKDLLTVQPNDTVQSVLSKIVNKLGGNFEFFYDTEGVFHFQEIKNYLNTSKASDDMNNFAIYSQEHNYLIDRTMGNAIYTFNTSDIVTSYTNTLNYEGIKNDYLIWGERNSANDTKLAYRYHLAIDTRPDVGATYSNLFFIVDQNNKYMPKMAISVNEKYDINTYGYYYYFQEQLWVYSKSLGRQLYIQAYNDLFNADKTLTEKGVLHSKHPNPYIVYKKIEDDGTISYWGFVTGILQKLSNIKDIDVNTVIDGKTKTEIAKLYTHTTTDYRTELLLRGLQQSVLQSSPNIYFDELNAEWYKIYNIKNGTWEQDIEDPTTLDYYLEIIDTSAAIGQFSIANIGKRTYAENNSNTNCLFEPQIPDIILINEEAEDKFEQIKECELQHYRYAVIPAVYYKTMYGDYYQDAYNIVRNLLYQYTDYNEAVSISTLPIYHLDVNTRITIKDTLTGIDGDYMISSYSVPFELNGTTSFSCVKCLQKI